jgi:hypothetical protein
MGAAWYGTEFWYVCTETWSMEAIYEAYFYLRLRYLRGMV